MNRPPFRFFAAACLFVALGCTTAVPATPSKWSVDVWQSDDGLPNNNVTGLAQTDDGHLWIANSGELTRFDGVSFEPFGASEIPTRDEKVTSVVSTRRGSLYLGLDHGALIQLDGDTPRRLTAGLPDLIAWSLTEAPDGSIWVLYGGNTIGRWHDGHATLFTEPKGLPLRPRGGCSLAADSAGTVWMATAGALHRFEGEAFRIIQKLGDAETPLRIASSQQSGLWICRGLRVMRYDAATGAVSPIGALNAAELGNEVTAILEDQHGELWIGTSASGLFHQTARGFERIATSHGRISSLLEDRDGHVWVATRGGGLNRVRPRIIDVETIGGVTAPRRALQSVTQATDGTLWATTEDGLLVRRQSDTWSVVSAMPDWPGGRATCVSSDGDGGVWIGTRNSRVHHWKNDRFTTLDREDGLTSHVFHAIAAADHGDVWIGGEVPETLARVRQGRVQTYDLPAGIRIIRAMTIDRQGDPWLGTSKGMLLHVHNDRVVDETAATTGAPLSIRTLYCTPDGTLWIGYVGGGVGRYCEGKFARITRTEGLYDDVVSQIVADDHGWLWFGAERGIFKVRQQELDAVAERRSSRVRSIHYGRDVGLPSLQATAGDSSGAIRDRDGRLWIALRTGIAGIDPAQLSERREPPAVMLKRFAVDERLVAFYGGIVPAKPLLDLAKTPADAPGLQLPPAHRRLQFDFTARGLAPAESVYFRYRLLGIDDTWLEAGSARRATYSRLPAGAYRFEVTGSGSDGVWNETPDALAFTVAPFFWQTWWFRIGTIALFTSSVVAIGRYVTFRRLRAKLRTLQEKAALNQERARIAKDIHDDLGGTLTQIILQLDATRKNCADPARTTAQLQQLAATTREAVQSLDEIVWAANPSNDVLSAFVDYLGQFAVEYLQLANIRCRFDLPPHPPPVPLAPEVRHNLFLVLKESLTNVVRHAGATEVRLQITSSPTELTMRVSDDGCGFNPEAVAHDGNGLGNMAQRMETIGGRLARETRPGDGTTIIATLPWTS